MRLLLSWVAVVAAGPALPGEVQSVLDVFAAEPDIRTVQEMVVLESGTGPGVAARWQDAARSAAVLPQLQVKYSYGNGLGNDFDYVAPDETSVPIVAPSAAAVDIDHKFELKARWNLDELVMSSQQVRVFAQVQDLVELREELLDEVTHLYFERRRRQIRLLLEPGGTENQLGLRLEIDELTARIDALCGGRYTRALAHSAARAGP